MRMNNESFNQVVKNMTAESLLMDVLLVWENGITYKHIFGECEKNGSLRSLSKPITCLCFGIAIEQGLFPNGLKELIFPYLGKQKITNIENINYLKRLTIYHLLTLTLGHENKMLDSKHLATIQGLDYADVVLNSPILHEPGEYFIYTNAATYIASVVFQNATGKKLIDFAKEFIFNPLEIREVTWTESPQGYNMGCTGLEIFADDLLKIGEVLINKGTYKGMRIIGEEWIDSMLTPQIKTPTMFDPNRVLPKYAYGFNMWICEDGISYCDGTDGQYLILIPKKKIIIITFGHQNNMKPITVCLKPIIR